MMMYGEFGSHSILALILVVTVDVAVDVAVDETDWARIGGDKTRRRREAIAATSTPAP